MARVMWINRFWPLHAQSVPESVPIIVLTPTDALRTVFARIDAEQSRTMVLVVPRGSRNLNSVIAFDLLYGHAQNQNKVIHIVAYDRTTERLARRAGFLLTSHSAADGNNATPAAPAASQDATAALAARARYFWVTTWPRVSTIVTMLALILVPTAIGVAVLPTATVTVVSEALPREEAFEVVAATGQPIVDPVTRRIPARPMEVVVEGTERLPLSGQSAQQGGSRATGEVLFTNNSNNAVTIPKDAVVMTKEDTRFTTLSEVRLDGRTGSTARTTVQAIDIGRKGNVPAGAIAQFVDDRLASAAKVANPAPTAGGDEQSARGVTFQDQEKLRTNLFGRLRDEGWNALFHGKAESQSIYPESLSLDIISEDYRGPEGDPPAVSLTARVRVRAIAFENRDVVRLGDDALARLADKEHHFVANSAEVMPLGMVSSAPDRVNFYVRAKGNFMPGPDPEALKSVVMGKTAGAAQQAIRDLVPGITTARVEINPPWVRRIPRLPWRINVRTSDALPAAQAITPRP